MSLTDLQKETIKAHLLLKIREKLAKYKPETSFMPFHYNLLGKDRMALFSFIQSVNTTLGTSIFEQIGKMIAEPTVQRSICRYKNFSGYISESAVMKIDHIMRSLCDGTRTPDKKKETEEILSVARQGIMGKTIKKQIDLFVEMKDGAEYYYELKTAKPNTNEFAMIKRQTLEWIAMRGSDNPNVNIKTIVAIPYNPYEPEPYQRWTLRGLFDLDQEILVGKDFWDSLGGANTYEELLAVFKEAGIEIYDEIDKKMKLL